MYYYWYKTKAEMPSRVIWLHSCLLFIITKSYLFIPIGKT